MPEEHNQRTQDYLGEKNQRAILGMDVVSFCILTDDNQLGVIRKLMAFMREALAFHAISDDEVRWSPAGDGGYFTFVTDSASRLAIDVAFSLFEKIKFQPRDAPDHFAIRTALHAGIVREGVDAFRTTNIWGSGINTTARILSTSKPFQLLVSAQYFDDYIKDQREKEFSFGSSYSRTVKHGVHVQVMNATRSELCLSDGEAARNQWSHIGDLWEKMAEEYEFLVSDTLRSADTLAAIGAAKFLLALGKRERVREFCRILSTDESTPRSGYPQQGHNLFTAMPADVLMEVLDIINPRFLNAGEIICKDGLAADVCYLPLAGTVQIECLGHETPVPLRKGVVYGEMGLWVSNLIHSETARATEAGLVLELRHRDFCSILGRHPGVADVVYGMIKLKVIENTWHSENLFPGLSTQTNRNFSHLSADCSKFAPGEKLDLTKYTYILLTGRVRIRAFNNVEAEITGGNRCDRMGVIGIISTIGKPDGESGEVLEETVAVMIPHQTLFELQLQYPNIGQTWISLCASRMDDVGFKIGHKSEVRGQNG